MSMERVKFEVAKALKEAGYPQDKSEYDEGYAISKVYYDVYSSRDYRWYPSSADTGRLLSFDNDYYYPEDCGEFCVAPSYMEAWLWLWEEKKFIIELQGQRTTGWSTPLFPNRFFHNQEQAIIAAIDYLVEYNLIK